MECQKTFKMFISEHIHALCTNVMIGTECRPDSDKGYRHDCERGYHCGKVRWGRAVTQWARTGSLVIYASLCLIPRNTLYNMLQGRS